MHSLHSLHNGRCCTPHSSSSNLLLDLQQAARVYLSSTDCASNFTAKQTTHFIPSAAESIYKPTTRRVNIRETLTSHIQLVSLLIYSEEAKERDKKNILQNCKLFKKLQSTMRVSCPRWQSRFFDRLLH